MQEKFVKNVQGLQATDYHGRLLELGIMTMENRRQYLDLVETFKIIKGYSNVKCNEYFSLYRDSNRPPTRGNDCGLNIVIERCNLDIRRKFFNVRVAHKWNDLPTELKQISSLNTFKNDLKSLMLNTI